ncbi:MAG: 50S ribosomal protein L13 [Thermoprotei archaeon]|nr:MAG: 50S ribosomal protein L13 [Thermoprotei archaeon]
MSEVLTFEEVLERAAQSRVINIDAEGAVLGRLATYVAKLLLMGYTVNVVNVEKAVVTGDKKMVIESYKLWLEVRTHKNPYRHAPRRPRNPIHIFKKAVKGMLPKENWRGFKAYRRLKAYVGVPEELKGKEFVKIEDTLTDKLKRLETVTIAEIAKSMGWKGVGL